MLDNLLLPRVIEHFTGAHPGIGIRVERLWQRDIESAVRAGDLDLGIGLDPPGDPGVAIDVLGESPLAVIVAEGHPSAAPPGLPLAGLGGASLIVFPRNDSWLRELTDATLASAGVEPPCAIEMDSIEAILATVGRGLGAALLPRVVLGDRAGLRAIPIEGAELRARVGLFWRKGSVRSPAAVAFAESVAAVIRAEGLAPSG